LSALWGGARLVAITLLSVLGSLIVINNRRYTMKMWVDPPSGWRYGFPKIWTRQVPIQQWLIDNGYPEQDVEWASEHMRWWPVEEGDEDEQVAK
jgi:hypothetical protein